MDTQADEYDTPKSLQLEPNRPEHGPDSDPEDIELTKAHNDTWPILFTSSAILLAVLIVSLILIAEVFVVHVYSVTSGSIHSTAPLGITLAIAHASSVVVAVTVPYTVGLCAYVLAGRWLASSRDGGINRPTPYQLGTLMTTLNGANLAALWYSSAYLFGIGPTPGGKTLRKPPILRHAILMLFVVLALAYGSTGVETWLGVSSEAILYPVTMKAQSRSEGSLPGLGRQVNQTLCDQYNATYSPYQCGLGLGSGGSPEITSKRLLTLNGVSNTNVVAFTDDSTAIMVPPTSQLPNNFNYVATTFGVKSSCITVTSQCVDPDVFSPDAGLILNCSSFVNFNTSASTGCNPGADLGVAISSGGPLDPNGTALSCGETVDSTQFRFGIIVISDAYNIESADSDSFVGQTGFFLHGNKGGYNVLTCDMESLVVTYRYTNGSYSFLNSSSSDLPQAQRVSDGAMGAPQYVPSAIEGVGLYSGSYTDSFAIKLSQISLSMTSYVLEPTEALETQNIQPNIGSRLQMAPFVLLLIISGIYCLLVAVVTVMALVETQKSPQTSFARSRLIDPATAISSAYGTNESKLKWTGSRTELFGHETDADRLDIGVTQWDDGQSALNVRRTLLAPKRGESSYSSLRTFSPPP